MMNPKEWQLTGEARASDRPMDSLLQVHLDFNTATKLPPTITRETTNMIDALIKQRVLDELFDDPVLLQGKSKRRKLDATEIDFNKSKTGLGE
jgi:U3 small nucleolar RNA-associated protein MPP10